MSSASDEAALRERLRLRALARFFTPNHITADIIRASHSSQPLSPSLSESTQLTAIAQNGALKLQCDRAFVSLIDASTLYVVAEATRSISLKDPTRISTPQDALLLGVQYLQKSYGICPNSFAVFTDDTGELAVDSYDVVSNKTRHIIRDLSVLEEHKHRPYVTGFPHLRSYIEVPIKDPQGQVLGSYCCMDTKPRPDWFSDETVFILTEIAQCITDHFELQAVKFNHARGERLMQGLTEFTRNRPGHRKDTPNQNDAAPVQTDTPVEPHSCQEQLPSSPHASEPEDSDNESTSSPSTSTDDTDLTVPSSQCSDISNAPADKPSNDEPIQTRCFGTSRSGNIFSDAAALIREAMDLEGLVFLDGSEKVKSADHLAASTEPEDETACEVLGSSLASNSCDLGASHTPLLLHEASLSYLVDRHPDGCVFTADEYGILDHGEESAALPHEDIKELTLDKELPLELQTLVSKARSVLFLPLWDYSKESVFVGLVGWSADPTRVIEQQDMTCLSAFGNTFMTELARSEAVAISHAKSDFLSSVSHELRSPLHGVLASVELLEETSVDSTQTDLIEMIHSCGSTLLDTLNHLLDFSKINVFTNAKGHARNSTKKNGQNAPQNPLGQHTDDYLCRLVQDVVEGVHFGQASHQTSLSKSHAAPFDVFVDRETPVDPSLLVEYGCMTDGPPRKEVGDVVGLFLYMENRDDWYMHLCPGAWKRVVMNLVGNSLKYTEQGYIEVFLRMITDPKDLGKKSVQLTVKDTGIGMSESYIKHHLYQPFVQENPLANGTGLGLSIVKQIVEGLGGSISVESTPGSGTRFDVRVPVKPQVTDSTEKHPLGNEILDPSGELKGLTLCLLSGSPFDDDDVNPQTDLQRRRTAVMQAHVTALTKDWFDLKVVSAQVPADVDADIYLAEHLYVSNLLQSKPEEMAIFTGKRLILLDPLRSVSRSDITRLGYPIGPKSLYRAIFAALKTHTTSILPRDSDGKCIPTCKSRPPRPTSHESASANRIDSGVTLPVPVVVLAEVLPERSAEPESTEDQPFQHHLLLVDDNAINLKILSSYVKKMGISAETAENGLEAYERYKATKKPFTTVLMDLSMPLMNGFESSRAIRDFETKNPDRIPKSTTIVALTGLGSEASRQEAALSGIDEFLTKPVKLKVLKDILGVV